MKEANVEAENESGEGGERRDGALYRMQLQEGGVRAVMEDICDGRRWLRDVCVWAGFDGA